jgi:hypothetical protein
VRAQAKLGEDNMDFIEKLFGIDPDGGTGITEMSIIGLLVLGLFAYRVYRLGNRAEKRREV